MIASPETKVRWRSLAPLLCGKHRLDRGFQKDGRSKKAVLRGSNPKALAADALIKRVIKRRRVVPAEALAHGLSAHQIELLLSAEGGERPADGAHERFR